MELPKIKIKDFEGPFDLLLHLIKKNKMSIYNVKIFEITNQYLKYINEMKEMDLEITSEFIVVAATLIEIKSKHLLPKPKKEDENEEDDEKNLIEKLIVYKKIKGVSSFFRERHTSTGEVFAKKPELIEDTREIINTAELFKDINLIDLFNIYNNMLEIYNNKQNRNNVIQKKIYLDQYKIEDKLEFIMEKLKKQKAGNFFEFMGNCECKLECVVTFLALLEMIKQRMVKVYQSDNFMNILIERRAEDV
jgi:segregation and condensation protein A